MNITGPAGYVVYPDNIMKYIIITFISCVVFLGNSSAETIKVNPIKGATISIPTEVYFVTTGPRHMDRKALRISIIIEEVYPSIYVEEITYGDTEGDPDIITSSSWLNGFDIAKAFNYKDKYGYEYLTNLQFNSWTKWNEFTIKERHNKFKIKYNSNNNFDVSRIK